MQLQGRTAVVTGGTRGLGRAVARALADEGAIVVAAARDVRPDPPDKGGRVVHVKADVTVPQSMADLMRTAHERYGGPHIVVANAGVSRPGPVSVLSDEDWDAVVGTNLTGVFHTVRAAVPYLQEAGSGRIITMSSLLGRRAMPGASAYCASKAAVERFTEVCALELAPRGITVNCLSPGFIEEGQGRALMANETLWPRLRDTLASGRPGTGAEVARAAVFLASSESSYVNGAVLPVDGGVRW
ncbi:MULTISPECIES: SDR family NAD(P)-dependent oxidoreductase [unclassified Streptomyces]|uniref:SDR family NAD(P)-dependent oxidoreductase n=1 Tax=unclassified Streptomyces TaxID=2593676 RepID=UPI0038085646